jgi:hypothetical protein
MSTKQPEALRLADILEHPSVPLAVEQAAAAELRRLHSVNDELLKGLEKLIRLIEVEDAHLANFGEVEAARAVMAKATGETI